MIVSHAVDTALDKIDFTPFTGHAVFLNDKYVECVDKAYVVSSVRHRVLKAGGRLVDSADASDVVVELRSGAVGTTSSNSYIGIPEIVLPGMLTLPEVRVAERKNQKGTAKLGIVAYDPKTGEALGTGGMTLAQADDNNWYFVGAGPFRTGSVSDEISMRTRGPAAHRYTTLPTVVSFTRPPLPIEQLATEELPANKVDPASFEQPAPQPVEKSSAPEWATPAN